MTNWKVYLYEPAAVDEFFNLPPGLQGRLFALFEFIEQVGLPNIPPKRRKHLRESIWELRVEALEGAARALYITRAAAVIVLVVFAKKTEQTPPQVIALAERRSREV